MIKSRARFVSSRERGSRLMGGCVIDFARHQLPIFSVHGRGDLCPSIVGISAGIAIDCFIYSISSRS